MTTWNNPGRVSRSPVIVSIKVLVVWFFLARAIFVVGAAYGVVQGTLWTLDIVLFALTVVYVMVRESVSEGGMSTSVLIYLLLLPAGGFGIFSSLPRNIKEMVHEPKGILENFQIMFDADQKVFVGMPPIEHLSRASKLIFENPITEESLALARRHLHRIPSNAVEFPSAQALLKVADLRSLELQGSKRDKNDPAITGQAVEVIGNERTPKGWSVTVRNNTARSIRNVRYEMYCFNSEGWQIEVDRQRPPLEHVIPANKSWTFNIGLDEVPSETVNASFSIMSWKVQE
jgi:hypothetical protein